MFLIYTAAPSELTVNTNMMLDFNIAQAFGILSFMIGACAFLQKNDQHLKVYLCFLFGCQTTHFYLLGAYTAVAANALSLIRTIISVRYSKAWLGIVFICANVFWGVLLYTTPISLLAIAGACFGTYAVFFLQGIPMRIAFILGAVSWLTHNLFVQSVGATLLEIMVIITNLITIYRLYNDNKSVPVITQ
ncbi:hypothetical protein DS2_17452 [Catenovulum agarivorans DS-2]|uniref:Inner membrane protein n=1 Tax=Catenovulum agarivorans DS-2 TaxID=1328313 RepID=W7QSQ4_9ALTE|nr:hypothetical protein DS2_17452 [Catenovulum agarivorans DS-2]